jgi:hypothetical protein
VSSCRRLELHGILAAAGMAGLVAACGPGKTVATLPPGFRQDTFGQEAASKIDVLWVIDNSASMASVQEELSTSLTRFMDTLSRGLVDYRIAVTTTDVFGDQGQFVGNPAVIDPSLPDPVFQFQRSVRVGTQGKGHEEGFEAARLAIEREKASAAAVLEELDACLAGCAGAPQACRDDCARRHEPRFMRRGAHLYLVFVSDEEEQSAGEVRFFQRTFESALGAGNEGAVAVAAICGVAPIPQPCKARAGVRYAALAAATGGITASICDPTFDAHLQRLALDAAGLKHKFALAARPDLSTLGVEVRYRCDTVRSELHCESVDDGCAGKARDARALVCRPRKGEVDGYSFEESTQSLFFRGASVPGLRSEVVASYQVAAD